MENSLNLMLIEHGLDSVLIADVNGKKEEVRMAYSRLIPVKAQDSIGLARGQKSLCCESPQIP